MTCTFGCTGRLALGGRVTGAPFATPGESRERGAVAVTGNLSMGIGWSEDERHAFVPSARLNGGGIFADDSAGLVQEELVFNYTWLRKRKKVGLRAEAIAGGGFLIQGDQSGHPEEPETNQAPETGGAFHVGAAVGAYFVSTDGGGGGGGKGSFLPSPDRTTSGVSATVGVLQGFDETEGPMLFVGADWGLLTFGD